MKQLTKNEMLGRLRKGKIGGTTEKTLRKVMKTGITGEAKEKFVRLIRGKTETGRKEVYKRLGVEGSEKKKIEGALKEEKKSAGTEELKKSGYREREAARKKEEMLKRRNIFLSRRSTKERTGAGFETSRGRFATGEVETRTRIGAKGADEGTGTARDLSDKSTFAQGRSAPDLSSAATADIGKGDDVASDKKDNPGDNVLPPSFSLE